jgi:predicted transcriptional regulator
MKFTVAKRTTFFAIAIAVALIARPVRAQEAAPSIAASEDLHRVKDDVRRAGEEARRAGEEARRAGEDALRELKVGPFQHSLSAKIRQAAEEVRDAKDDSAKTEANAKLHELLDQCFSDDMTQRQKELESIQGRLQKLQAQLERRRAKEDEIIDLAVKNAVNDADGLGLYSERPGGPFEFSIATPVKVSTFPGSVDGNLFMPAPGAALPGPPSLTAPAAPVPPKPPAPAAPAATLPK